ncbi:MAG: methyltransferase domain-containing protein [Alphaproteobacteria bacterium]|nr:methyltransferase domain-containing protein [Alphaproteobacteria bacterium]MBL6940443.1 methyltransferase domain-containing protein [Alphaproteobacteria bacterium]MBL7099686.1 methyltransferase domain-containing protein [Alphaproteobacteria bacterium]
MSDTLRFLGRLIARPVYTGAVAPSGPGLSRAMAAQVPPNADGPILELGPGTGVVTAAMLARGIAADRITAVEYDRDFAAMVATRYPDVHVINGDAFDLEKTLGDGPKTGFAAILSSMPLVNFPMALRQKLLADILERLRPGAPFIQFSYRLRAPVPPPAGVTVTQAAFILLNVPPARVWVYRRR